MRRIAAPCLHGCGTFASLGVAFPLASDAVRRAELPRQRPSVTIGGKRSDRCAVQPVDRHVDPVYTCAIRGESSFGTARFWAWRVEMSWE
ncbi:hypothetical protein TNCT6_71020 [Streptomyces sp. 6-11-2]|nr:hypothetical protein TNCT6_71020 [Streptomyces sp. 6-11-2]